MVNFLLFILMSHAGHHHLAEGNYENLNPGFLHHFLVHFPIALVVMTVIAELLFSWTGKNLYTQAARFMLIASAVIIIPTALTGLLLSYTTLFEGAGVVLFWWHRFFGFTSVGLTVAAVILREFHTLKGAPTLVVYYLILALLFVSILMTGILGGMMVF